MSAHPQAAAEPASADPAADQAAHQTAGQAVDPAAAGPWLLALHSSSPVLGVGLRDLSGRRPDRLASFDLGRGLSNALLACVEQVCPAELWPRLARLAVATGPGGFTGTRLTVVLARTLAQQLQLPLDGIGSLELIARRLQLGQPTWLVQELPRRGVVAGLYGPSAAAAGGSAEAAAALAITEHLPPRLHPDRQALTALDPAPQRPAAVEVEADVAVLLDCATAAHRQGLAAPWQPVLPLYPTSPVDGLTPVAVTPEASAGRPEVG